MNPTLMTFWPQADKAVFPLFIKSEHFNDERYIFTKVCEEFYADGSAQNGQK